MRSKLRQIFLIQRAHRVLSKTAHQAVHWRKIYVASQMNYVQCRLMSKKDDFIQLSGTSFHVAI